MEGERRGEGEGGGVWRRNPLNISYATLILVILPAAAVYLRLLRSERKQVDFFPRQSDGPPTPASLLNNKIALLKYLDFDSH